MLHRHEAPELLDGPVADLAALDASFREVWGVNRYLGGVAVLRRHLAPWLGRWHLSLLDVAGGPGDVACHLAGWARRRGGTSLQVTVLDNHPQVLQLARARTERTPAATVVQGDARSLPFPDGAFDVAVCNLALHHFPPGDAAMVLREMDRVARLGWVVADLERHPAAYLSARILARTLWTSPITRHDGPLSVRRAYTAAEAAGLVEAAGVRAVVTRHFPFRWAAVCRRRP